VWPGSASTPSIRSAASSTTPWAGGVPGRRVSFAMSCTGLAAGAPAFPLGGTLGVDLRPAAAAAGAAGRLHALRRGGPGAVLGAAGPLARSVAAMTPEQLEVPGFGQYPNGSDPRSRLSPSSGGPTWSSSTTWPRSPCFATCIEPAPQAPTRFKQASSADHQIRSLVLSVRLVGSRRIWPAQVGCLVDPVGSRRVPSDRLDDQPDDQATP
jgi:hypothetical protein